MRNISRSTTLEVDLKNFLEQIKEEVYELIKKTKQKNIYSSVQEVLRKYKEEKK